MKKLVRAVALLSIPIVLYYLFVFLPFEPNNYFGLRGQTPTGAVFGALRQYRQSPKSTVILGDSRMAHFSRTQTQSLAGEDVANLAFGGASLAEELDELYWLLEQYPEIDEVIFGLSFYTLNANYGTDRWQAILDSMRNPLLYATNVSFNMEAVQNLFAVLGGGQLGGGELETEDPAAYEWAEYTMPATGEAVTLRTRVGEHMKLMEGYLAGWRLDEEGLARLEGAIEHCAEKDVRFVVVLPPLHPALRQHSIEPRGIDAVMEDVVARLGKTGALVLDYEFTSPPEYAEDMYFDSLHLDYERGLPVWLETLFGDIYG